MASGNQREKAREKNLKKTEVRLTPNNRSSGRSTTANIHRTYTDMACFVPTEDQDYHERYPDAAR